MTRKLFIGFIAVLAMSLWFVGCTTHPVPPDEIPPVVTIDSPVQGDDIEICGAFSVTGTASDVDPGLVAITLLIDGEVVGTETLDTVASTDYEFTVDISEFNVTCGDVVIEVVAEDGEGNEDTESIDVTVCNDDAAPVVEITPETADLFNDQWIWMMVAVTEDNVEGCGATINGVEYSGDISANSTGYQFMVSKLYLNEGPNTVVFTVTDKCENVGSDIAVISYAEEGLIVELVSPTAGQTFCEGITFVAEADYQDRDEPVVEQVKFYIDGYPYVATEDSGVWSYALLGDAWDILGEGSHSVYAKAWGSEGDIVESDPVGFFVDCGNLVVEITNPISGDDLCGEVTFAASANYREMPGITSIEFWFDVEGQKRWLDTTAPYEYTVDVFAVFDEGPHTVYAVANLETGARVESGYVAWNRACGIPEITLTSPSSPGETLCEAYTFSAEVDLGGIEYTEIESVDFYIDNIAYAAEESGDEWVYSVDNAWENWDLGDHSVYAEVVANTGTSTTEESSFFVSCVDPVVEVTYDSEDECLCGPVVFTATAAYRDLPGIVEVQFFFDEDTVARFTDQEAPFEYSVDVSEDFEPATHTVYAVAVMEDGDEVPSPLVPWVKSCQPEAWVIINSIDHCNRTVIITAGWADDNVEPAKTFDFAANTCEGSWSHDQLNDYDDTVTFSFDPDVCGYGDYEISVTVYDGWCEGFATAIGTVTFVDDCFGDLDFSDPMDIGVYGDSQATWPLAATANDRLVMPELTAVDFFYDIDATVPPGEPNFGALCSAEDNGDGTWGCDFDSADLPDVGGYYYFHVTSTDNAENTQWAAPQMFWKSDMPAGLNLVEEHEDGNYYDNGFATLPFTLTFTDDNLADAVTTYTVYWDFSDGGHYVTSVGALDLGTSAITHTFDALGSYTLDVYIVEYTPVDDRNVMVTSLTETWTICLEIDPPAVTSFNVENIPFIADEGPYDNDWVNPNDFLVCDFDEHHTDLGSTFEADDVDVGNCVSGCDYFTIELTSVEWPYYHMITVACGETYQDIIWDNYDAGEWTVDFTVYDKAGNMATAQEIVTKSDFPTYETLAFYTNEWPLGTWNCFQDPVGIPVRFDDWNSMDDSGYPLDSLLFEFTSSDGTNVWTEEIFSYDPNGFALPWVYWFEHYDDMTARIWSCDQWGQWWVSDDFDVNLQDLCAPDQPEIDEVDDFFNPAIAITNAWDRADVQSGGEGVPLEPCQIHLEYLVGDRDGESGPFGHSGPEVARVEIIAFDVADGYNGDPSYWTTNYPGVYDGTGVSAFTGVIATRSGGTAGDANWAVDSDFYGICGWFYVYAQAVDVNGNRSEPSFPVVLFKYSVPTFADCYVKAVDAELCMAIEMECPDDDEYTYDWNFGDGSPVLVDGGDNVCHTFTLAALRTVTVDFYVNGVFSGTTDTWVSVGDEQDPWVTNLDIAPYHPIDAPNDNEGNEGTKNAQYGDMYYDLTALDNGILQGVGGDSLSASVSVELWTDADGLPGGLPGTFVEAIERPQFLNEDCRDNEIEVRFMYNWDGKDRGYYFFRARAHDRSGNNTGDDTAPTTDDYLNLQLFHSDPPGSAETGGVLAIIGDYTNLHTLEFAVNADVSDDGDILGIKYQWDRRTDLRCTENGSWWSDPGFVVETEFSPPYDPDVWRLDYFEAGYGYNTPGDPYNTSDSRYGYRCTTSSTTSDGPAFRAVDEDGIYSQIIIFPVIIEDVSEPRLVWIDPDCSVNIDGNITLTVYASDYPEYNRDGLPGISKVQFLVNDVFIAEDTAPEPGDPFDYEIDGLTGPTYEFNHTFDVSAFLDAEFGPDYGGVALFEARAFDINEDQVGSREFECLESNDPVVAPAAACDLISGSQTVVFPFQNYISDDNDISYIEVNFGDGSGWWTINWANAHNYAYNYGAWGNWTVTVNVYDTAGDSTLGVVLSTDVWTDNVDPSADWAAGVPAIGELCVTADYPTDIMITPDNVADNSGCLDRVEFYLSDNGNPGTYEYYFTATGAPWTFPWYPYDQESKDIFVGIRVFDQAGNVFEFGIDDGSVWFEQDLKPWNPSIDHPEVWALLGADIELLGAGENDVNDPFDCAWDDDDDGSKDDTTNPISESVDPHYAPSGVAGNYTLRMGLEEAPCWLYNTDWTVLNTTTADIYVVDDIAPTITDFTVTPVETKQATIDFDVHDIDANLNCWWWEYAELTITSYSEGDDLHFATFYSAYQWNPTWPDNVSYEDPCFYGAENFTYTFDVGGFEDCDGPIGDVYVDVDGLPLGYNPYEDGDDLDVNIDAWDTESNMGNLAFQITISDVLAPEAPADAAYWIYPEPFATVVAGTPITVQVRPLDWHCANITDVEFFADEPAYDYASVNMDNFFGADTDVDADGIFEATTVLSVGSHTIGIFAWDDVVNESQQWFINITVVSP